MTLSIHFSTSKENGMNVTSNSLKEIFELDLIVLDLYEHIKAISWGLNTSSLQESIKLIMGLIMRIIYIIINAV